ncbi:pupal cuticle protein Edg-91-like [Palaemon carinicauda]|uniref:pupal cuticle protein Edg-91-like n=1 Tax=Palaemon carinicauda TaxID=392227 RepID=UPI0035B5754F
MQRTVSFLLLSAVALVAAQNKNTGNTRFGPGGFQGGFPGGHAGGFPGGHAGGFPGGQIGGFPGGQVGGFPGGQIGGFPGGQIGGFPGGQIGGFPGGQIGGFPGGHSGGIAGCPPVPPPRPVCKFYVRNHCGHFVCSVDQKPFECPPVRPECPGLRFGPQICYTDNDCAGSDKCCADACLDHLTCKGHSSGVLF